MDNGSFQGWVFEYQYEVINLIVNGYIKLTGGILDDWCIGANYVYYDTTDAIAFNNLQNDTWLL